MTSTTELSNIWQPLQIGPMQVKHRIMVPARILNWSPQGVLSERHLNHYRELVAGGAALIVTEQHAAYEVAKGSFKNGCTAWETRAIPGFEKTAEIVHAGGARGIVQLYGPGIHDKGTLIVDEWHPLWGVSDIPSVLHNEVPMVMGQNEINEIIKGYGRSARNVRDGGLDGVEIHAAHGYMLCQFLSRATNNRTDSYGGSIENRCRIIVEIAQEIRNQVGNDLAVGVRLSYEEFIGDIGITPEEADQHVAILLGTGLIDYFSISVGNYHTQHHTVSPAMVDDGHLVPYAARAKQIVGDRAAVFTVGRVRDLHLAEDIIRSGAADMVALGRAHLADPHIVRKTREGRENEVIRCTGVNECVGRIYDGNEVLCMMNPVTGREQQWSHLPPAEPDAIKKVLVVGGGPAGMKLAAVAATRGHQVTLVERDDTLGGHLNLLGGLPTQNGWNIATEDLVAAVHNAGVEIRLGTTVDADFVRNFDADKVFIAEGSRYDDRGASVWNPGLDEVPGVHGPNVLCVDDAVRTVLTDGGAALGEHVVIIDESGTYLPAGLAEVLAQQGTRVEIVTPQMFVGSDLFRRLELPWVMPRLRELGVEFLSQHRMVEVKDDVLVLADLWSNKEELIKDVSTIVLSVYQRSNTELFDQLSDLGDRVERIGDAVAPRKLSAILYDSEKAARAL